MKKKSFKKIYSDARKRNSYWVAEAILDFTEDIYRLMEQKKINKADLAKKMGVTPAYITKILRGNVNFTLETMVRLARSVGGTFHTHVAPEDTQVAWAYNFDLDQKKEIYAPAPQISPLAAQSYWKYRTISMTSFGVFSKFMPMKSGEPVIEEKEIVKTHAAA